MPGKEVYDVAIIGAGIVGLAGAVYARRMNLKTIVFGNERGGTLAKTHLVENYPGFISLSGPELMDKILAHAKVYDPTIIMRAVLDIKKKGKLFELSTKKESYQAKMVLFATGSKWKKLNIPGEEEFKNKGVHYCASCDAPLYKGKKTAVVVGGGDSAVKESLLVAEYFDEVYVLARSTFKPEPINMQRAQANKKIHLIDGIQVKEIKGDKFANEVILDKPINNSTSLKMDAIFIEIGHIPLSDLAIKLGVKTNKKGEIIITREARTNIPNIYAAGDVGDLKFKQAITGVGEAVTAMYSIYDDLAIDGLELKGYS
ncbi:MAG TPA: FAD-dependent oxidoreductase [Candidatus Pacearchaeota archaeon]|jgi:thioredoxin reductase|nr:FAD-dependent oxidoreductase [Candidatus Pacearchaeota archaeon]